MFGVLYGSPVVTTTPETADTLADPETAPELAVMVAVPGPAIATVPVWSTAATDGLEEDQLADFVMSPVLPSLYVPVALS